MELDRKVVLCKNIIQALEDGYEGACMELKICVKVNDEKNAEILKKSALELDKKIEAARSMLAEYEASIEQKV